jgi:hypothetical protein
LTILPECIKGIHYVEERYYQKNFCDNVRFWLLSGIIYLIINGDALKKGEREITLSCPSYSDITDTDSFFIQMRETLWNLSIFTSGEESLWQNSGYAPG